jgi:hypothetical protein
VPEKEALALGVVPAENFMYFVVPPVTTLAAVPVNVALALGVVPALNEPCASTYLILPVAVEVFAVNVIVG